MHATFSISAGITCMLRFPFVVNQPPHLHPYLRVLRPLSINHNCQDPQQQGNTNTLTSATPPPVSVANSAKTAMQTAQQQPPAADTVPATTAPLPSPQPSTATTQPAFLSESVVFNYLRTKGYKQTEDMLRAETTRVQSLNDLASELDPEKSLSDYVTTRDNVDDEENADTCEQSYKALRRFVETSLDMYKHELQTTLYPIFVHAYLNQISKGSTLTAQRFMATFKDDHELQAPDVARLATVTTPEQVLENQAAKLYRSNKFNLDLSEYSMELFIGFLQDRKFKSLLQIVNQHININVVPGKPLQHGNGTDQSSNLGITGLGTQQVAKFNEQPVTLGTVPGDQAFLDEVERLLKEEDASSVGDDEDDPMEDNPLSFDDYRKQKQDKKGITGPTREDIPRPPLKGADIQAEIEAIKSLRVRVALGSACLPSICCYTFHNTHESLNCVSISHDATLMSGGFSESCVKIWSMKPGEKLTGMKSNFNPANIHNASDLKRIREKNGSEYKRLIGHSGPVYGLSTSHDTKYLLSCSEDKTARLWSTDTFSPLVVYKGHNYPVWDVDFGPFGFYFATCSHDRTARVWSCDNITPLRIFAGHLADVDTVRFHPNSKYILTGSSDKTSRMWDVQKGACVRVFSYLGSGAVTNLAISPDGQIMASSGEDNLISLWDLGSGRLIKKMSGHTGPIYSMDFSRDGTVLASGSADCTVRIWDVRKAQSSSSSTEQRRSSHHDAVAAVKDVAPDVKLEDGLSASSAIADGYSATRSELTTDDHLGSFGTRRTPVFKVQFTTRNLLLTAGAINLNL